MYKRLSFANNGYEYIDELMVREILLVFTLLTIGYLENEKHIYLNAN